MRFKVGDRVRIKSLDWYNENKDKDGNIVFYSKVPHFSWCENVRTVFTKDMVKFCGKVVTIERVWTVNYSIVEGTNIDYFVDEMIEGLVEEDNNMSNIDKLKRISTPAEEDWFKIAEEWEKEDNNAEKMVSVDKVKDWLYINFTETYRDGDYDYGQPYIISSFDTLTEMFDSFNELIKE